VSDKYKIYDNDKAYFVTLTVVDWIDIFSKNNHKLLIIDSLKFCQKNKGLVIYAWCLMPSHLHMIIASDPLMINGLEHFYTLSEILRDFKKFTAKAIIKQIQEEPESRREWLLNAFSNAGKNLKRIKNYKFWQDGNHAMEIHTPEFFYEKLDYIHNNPVEEMIVSKAEDYMFSSARNYAGLDYLLEVILESVRLRTC